MKISAKDVVALLKKLDEAEETAQAAFSSYSSEDQQASLEKLGELRQALYSALAQAAEDGTPYPVLYPVYPYKDTSWREFPRVTCSSSSGDTSGNG